MSYLKYLPAVNKYALPLGQTTGAVSIRSASVSTMYSWLSALRIASCGRPLAKPWAPLWPYAMSSVPATEWLHSCTKVPNFESSPVGGAENQSEQSQTVSEPG